MISWRSKITQDVLSYFFLHEGASLYVNELARRLGHDSGNLTRKLIELERNGLLKSEAKGVQKYYSLNPSFPLLNEYKRITLKSVGLERLLRDALLGVPELEKAYLFGSYAEDKMDMASDIDLLAIGRHKPLALQKAILDVQKKTEREINAMSFTPKEFEKKRRDDPFLKSVLQKPRVILR
ncbi:MAG: nucleotidyltransferase domain-containing protein [Elusimicrobia bacterium]|nr:nucleotidyltransferase domain-containing protein [Candidatus Obscuribacterium magneticum]